MHCSWIQAVVGSRAHSPVAQASVSFPGGEEFEQCESRMAGVSYNCVNSGFHATVENFT